MARPIPEEWRDPATGLEVGAWEVDPHDMDSVRRRVGGLVPGSVRLTYGYRSDARVSAEMEVAGEALLDGSWVRLTLSVGGREEELATLCVARRSTDRRTGVTRYTLQSAIWAISEDRLSWEWTVAAGTRCSTAIRSACEATGRPYVLMPTFSDSQYGETVGFERRDAFSSFLFDAAERAGARMDVDGHGRLAFSGYVPPAQRQADWAVDERDGRSVVIDEGRTDEDRAGEAYGRTVVVHYVGEGDGRSAVTGQWDAPASHPASSARRGYTRTNVREVGDMSPETAERAAQLARQHGERTDGALGVERKATLMWCPVTAGDVLEWTDPGGAVTRWLVRTVECDCATWTKELVMEAVGEWTR